MRFEYKVVRLPDHDWQKQTKVLNDYGAEGWQLVAMLDGLAYFMLTVDPIPWQKLQDDLGTKS